MEAGVLGRTTSRGRGAPRRWALVAGFGLMSLSAILPLVSLRYDKVTVFSTYIPTLNGGINHGSILYVFGRIAID